MSTNRSFIFLAVTALVIAAALVLVQNPATHAAAPDMDSATRSYTAWAKAEQAQSAAIPVTGNVQPIDSATRSYTAWAKAEQCGADLVYDPTIDSATRSYMAWAKSVEYGCAH
ncbi:MAG: hypothetical protein ACOYYJ_15110 [Chloroflexota bacterium]